MTQTLDFDTVRRIDPPHSPVCTQTLIRVEDRYFILSVDHRNDETVAYCATPDGEYHAASDEAMHDATLVAGTDAVALLRCVAKLLEYLRARPADAQATPTAPQGGDQGDEPKLWAVRFRSGKTYAVGSHAEARGLKDQMDLFDREAAEGVKAYAEIIPSPFSPEEHAEQIRTRYFPRAL